MPRRNSPIDFVALSALLAGLMSFIFPFAALKENRVVDGNPISGWGLSSPLLSGTAIAVALLVVILTFSASSFDFRLRRIVYSVASCLCFWLPAFFLARAGTMLPPGAASRVSPALGFWGLPLAGCIFINHLKGSSKAGRGHLAALILIILIPAVLILSGGRAAPISIVREFTANNNRFFDESLMHLRLFAAAVALATLIGIPMGVIASRRTRLAATLIAFVDGAQTIPSMALFGLLMAPLSALSRTFPILRNLGIMGIGSAPALIALSLYALLPIVRNTLAGLRAVPQSSVEAGYAMGMSAKQLFRRVCWPMALPYVLTGLRTASVQAVGNTAVAALIGAGGLGMLIFQGLGQAAPDLVLLGVIPLILLAVLVDRLWGCLSDVWVSSGLKV